MYEDPASGGAMCISAVKTFWFDAAHVLFVWFVELLSAFMGLACGAVAYEQKAAKQGIITSQKTTKNSSSTTVAFSLLYSMRLL